MPYCIGDLKRDPNLLIKRTTHIGAEIITNMFPYGSYSSYTKGAQNLTEIIKAPALANIYVYICSNTVPSGSFV